MCTVFVEDLSWGSSTLIDQLKNPCNSNFRGSDSLLGLPWQLKYIYSTQTHVHIHNVKLKKKTKSNYSAHIGLGVGDASFLNTK